MRLFNNSVITSYLTSLLITVLVINITREKPGEPTDLSILLDDLHSRYKNSTFIIETDGNEIPDYTWTSSNELEGNTSVLCTLNNRELKMGTQVLLSESEDFYNCILPFINDMRSGNEFRLSFAVIENIGNYYRYTSVGYQSATNTIAAEKKLLDSDDLEFAKEVKLSDLPEGLQKIITSGFDNHSDELMELMESSLLISGITDLTPSQLN